ncbi:MAG: Capsule synthesis protein CapA [Anaerosolibacter sp.]|uniref:CapA family protein n=1 Tax=Anaerosolibacter sp. TaxID=1872527 RepID=UPI0026126B36|nr:CapA family protein [Anaerosolibacter sp.]MDF2547306.1 Capsule synthesis protein CapA [Anaerosolibacter sp.]
MFIKLTLSLLLMVSNLVYPQLPILNIVSTGHIEVKEIQKMEAIQHETKDANRGQKPVFTIEQKKEEHTAEENVEKVVKEYDEVITISFAGDCTLGWDDTSAYMNSFPYRLEENGGDFSYFFEGVKDIFEADDLTLVNLETTFTTSMKKADKKFRFKGDPSYTGILKAGSIEMVNIANNHIYDYLNQGFHDTMAALGQDGILYSGEGFMGLMTIKGIRIISLGYRGWDVSIKTKLEEDITRAKELGDIVLVSFHWGEERKYYPNKTQQALGHYAIDFGADIVVGHHPHVMQGIEKYKDKYIIYSLGNFSFGGNKNPADKDSFIFQNKFYVKDQAVVKNDGFVIPCKISSRKEVNDYQPTVALGGEGTKIIERLLLYSTKLQNGIQEEDIMQTADTTN